MAPAWQRREALELRYDGPVPAQAGDDSVAALRRRMRLHRRLALAYARGLSLGNGDGGRLRRRLAAERRSHSRLARLLGEALRRDLSRPPPLFPAGPLPHV